MNARALRHASCVALVVALAAGSPARADEPAAAPTPSAPPAPWIVTTSSEGIVFVPEPLGAPPTRRIDLAAGLARGDGPFARARGGFAWRSLGHDILALAEAGIRGTIPAGVSGEFAVGAGLRQEFTRGDLYVADESGRVRRAPDTGIPYLALGAAAAVGYDLFAALSLPVEISLVPRVQLSMPQRDQAAVEVGVGLRLAWRFSF